MPEPAVDHPSSPSRLRRIRGRDPHERGRTATTLELLFDLTFAAGFGVAGAQFAHMIAENELGPGLLAYCVSVFAIVWAWINFTWFASAFDTDDWLYRLTTMVQMVGVVVVALGIPTFFASVEHHHVDNRVMVLGYVVMRVAMLSQWIRVIVQDPEHRRGAFVYVWTITAAQIGWSILAVTQTSLTVFLVGAAVLGLVELAGPVIAESRRPSPWHPHHMAERYGLLTIITLGEGVIGTVAAIAPSIESGDGWTLDAVLVVVAGIATTFGVWWMYFAVDFGTILHRPRRTSFAFGYGHIPLLGAVAAIGVGLHVTGYHLAHETHVSAQTVALTVVVPIALFTACLFALVTAMAGSTVSTSRWASSPWGCWPWPPSWPAAAWAWGGA